MDLYQIKKNNFVVKVPHWGFQVVVPVSEGRCTGAIRVVHNHVEIARSALWPHLDPCFDRVFIKFLGGVPEQPISRDQWIRYQGKINIEELKERLNAYL